MFYTRLKSLEYIIYLIGNGLKSSVFYRGNCGITFLICEWVMGKWN